MPVCCRVAPTAAGLRGDRHERAGPASEEHHGEHPEGDGDLVLDSPPGLTPSGSLGGSAAIVPGLHKQAEDLIIVEAGVNANEDPVIEVEVDQETPLSMAGTMENAVKARPP